MEKCKLCKINDANKKGSHVVPACILTNLFPRNKEFIYSITPKGIRLDIGHDVIDEEIVSNIGRSISDEELSSNQLPIIEDFIFCNKCEFELSHLETLYSQIHQNLQKLPPSDDIEIMSGKSTLISLFWYSVIWRISIAKVPFTLKGSDAEALRRYILLNLKGNLSELKNHIVKSPNECYLPIEIYFNSKKFSKASFWIEAINNANDYFIYCNEYIVVLYSKGHIRRSKPILNFGTQTAFKIRRVNNEAWKKLINIAAITAVSKMKNLK